MEKTGCITWHNHNHSSSGIFLSNSDWIKGTVDYADKDHGKIIFNPAELEPLPIEKHIGKKSPSSSFESCQLCFERTGEKWLRVKGTECPWMSGSVDYRGRKEAHKSLFDGMPAEKRRIIKDFMAAPLPHGGVLFPPEEAKYPTPTVENQTTQQKSSGQDIDTSASGPLEQQESMVDLDVHSSEEETSIPLPDTNTNEQQAHVHTSQIQISEQQSHESFTETLLLEQQASTSAVNPATADLKNKKSNTSISKTIKKFFSRLRR